MQSFRPHKLTWLGRIAIRIRWDWPWETLVRYGLATKEIKE